ncbi:ATP-binding cassette domain-containing protein [Kitasatospora aureofaciens]|uniref:ATP-binding cassette domain-containing protein n=1 Tax=Kitasatospora aureofaciens TaxID=1894 RepID=UPI0037CC3704
MDHEEAVVCRGLEYSFTHGRGKETRAVDGIDLTVRTGEVFGLLGPNGAGKTTTIRAITTLLPVGAGMVRVFGHDATRRPMEVRRLLGYVPQQLSAEAGLTGRENVALFARVFDVPRAERARRVTQALAAVDLTDAADRMAATYSGGMVRRLELAQALVSAPRLLVLDEPTIGLDPIARTGVWERVDAVRRATGMTVLVTTHYMDEADRHCDRIALMDRGRIRALGTPAELKDQVRQDGQQGQQGQEGEEGQQGQEGQEGRDSRDEPTLDDVFRHFAGRDLADATEGDFGDVRRTRRTANRVG